MLEHDRLPVTDAESEALGRLLETHPGQASITRRDAGDSGPLLVHIDDHTWLIDDDGKVTKQRKPAR